MKEGLSVCNHCKESKPLEHFPKCARKKNGRMGMCKPCFRARYDTPEKNRISALKNRYGISVEEFESLLKKQHRVCAICGGPNQDGRRIHVDHCHVTKRVRGLLCVRCNTTLGQIEIVGLAKFAAYLVSTPTNTRAR